MIKAVPDKKQTMLVIDCNQSARKFFSNIVPRMCPFMNVDLASGLEEAVICLEKRQYQYVVMDIDMDALNGIELYKQAEDLCSEYSWNQPCYIYCTSFPPPHMIQELAAEEDNHHVMRKPVSIMDIMSIVNTEKNALI